MKLRRWLVVGLLVLPLLLTPSAPTGAAELRYHYVPVDAAGNTQLAPVKQPGGAGSPGERVRVLGLVKEPANTQPRPTHLVTFRHPYTGRNITVPLALPPDTPRMEYSRRKIVYNYGSNTVEAHFNPDGTVDVVYSSGLLRRI
jgi:hypothetical protein